MAMIMLREVVPRNPFRSNVMCLKSDEIFVSEFESFD